MLFNQKQEQERREEVLGWLDVLWAEKEREDWRNEKAIWAALDSDPHALDWQQVWGYGLKNKRWWEGAWVIIHKVKRENE